MIYTGTTPTLTLQFGEDIDITQADSIIVTFSAPVTHQVILEKRDADLAIDAHSIGILLDQAETLKMPTKSDVLIQVNFLFNDGERTYRATSSIARLAFTRNLKEEIVEVI